MFSPSEYLTNLRQISLLNGLVTPRGQMPAIPPIPQMNVGPGIPVVATVPPAGGECNDMIGFLATSSLGLKIAAIVGTALIVAYFVKKYGKTILTGLRGKIQQILASIENKIRKQRTVYLLAPAPSMVIGWWFTEPRHIISTKAMPSLPAPNSFGLYGARYGWSLASSMTAAQSSWYSWVLTRFISSRAGALSNHGKSLPLWNAFQSCSKP